jgi:hypothetical protein
MSPAITSAQYASLATKALTLITDIRSAQKRADAIYAQADTLGIASAAQPNGTEIMVLARIAAMAVEQKHDAMKVEAMAEVTQVTEGRRTSGPSTWIGRKLTSLANIAG